jgi:hypothetical protein
MTYSPMTRSNTPPGRYHIRQTLSHWKKTDRKQQDRRQKPNHAMPRAPPKWPLMPLEASIIALCLNSVVDCAVGFNCLNFQSTAPLKVTHSPVVSWSCWKIYINLQYLACTVSKVQLLPAGASLIPWRSLSVPIMGCAVGVEIGDASPWWCWLRLDKRSGRSSFPF